MRWSALLLTLLALGPLAHGASAPYGGQLVVAYIDAPGSLNPVDANFGSAVAISWAFTNGLVKIDATGQDVPDLADRWEISRDGLTWTFTLRPNLTFSDGAPVTSADVVASFRPALDPSTQSAGGLLPQIVKSLAADGKGRVRFVLSEPYSLFTNLVQLPIVPARAVTGTAAERNAYAARPVGTGPFKLASQAEGLITFDANPFYYEGRPHLDTLVFRHYANQKAAWASLMQGQTDIVYDVDNEDYLVIKDDARFKTYPSTDGMCFPIIFNLKDPLISQLGVRRAISLAIDRQDLIEKALRGGGIATTGPFLPGTWAYNPDPSLQAFNPEESRKILASLGWKDTNGDWVVEKAGQPLQFGLLIDDNDPLKAATARRLQWQLLQVGIRMQIEVLPVDVFVQKRVLAGKFQAAIVQEGTFDNPDKAVSTFWSSQSIGAFNLGAYSNAKVDELIRVGKTTVSQDRKQEIYRQIHEFVANDYPAAFLYFKQRFTATSATVGGFALTQLGQFGASMVSWYVNKK